MATTKASILKTQEVSENKGVSRRVRQYVEGSARQEATANPVNSSSERVSGGKTSTTVEEASTSTTSSVEAASVSTTTSTDHEGFAIEFVIRVQNENPMPPTPLA